MKRAWIFLSLVGIGISILFVQLVQQRGQARAFTPEQLLYEARQYNQRWWQQISGQGSWLRITTIWENPLARGIDPDTHWPIFQRYRETLWYRFGQDDSIDMVIGESENANNSEQVYRFAWMPGYLVRKPPLTGVEQAAPERWPAHPIYDWCVTSLESILKEGYGTAKLSQKKGPSTMRIQAQIMLKETEMPPIAEPVSAVEIICQWEKGGISTLEQWFYTSTDKILFARSQVVDVQWTASPPAYLLHLLQISP